MSYFMVTAKCGHVGKGFYYKGNFYITAENARAAAKYVRECPRVKHDHQDAILSVNEIEYQDFISGRTEEQKKPYYHCESKQQQALYWDEISEFIYEDSHQEELREKSMKKTVRHSLKRCYNDDPAYASYKYYRGTINA